MTPSSTEDRNAALGFSSLPAVEYSIDSVTRERIRGWCWFPDRPDLVAQLQARAGGIVVAEAQADQFRKDLADAGKRDGYCRFDIILPPRWHVHGQSLSVQLADGRALPIDAKAFDALPPGEREPDVSWPVTLMGVEGYLEGLGPNIHGWVTPPGGLAAARLSICERDTVLLTIDAKDWRRDLEDSHDGDGRGGFDVPVPLALRDGKAHWIDIRLGEDSLLQELLRVQFDAAPPLEPPVPVSLTGRFGGIAKSIRDAVTPIDFSFIVNFYNMRREAERTLTSLTRAYQRDSENIRYEVICVDNGSNPPLDADWVASFGPEFRLVRPSKILPSPCFALNEAARQAKGKHIAAMIDGAHVLSPGTFREAKAAIDENRNTVVGLRQWFFGGDQRWLNQVGYTREQEDILFARADWPNDGYKLFEVSVPMSESPNDWFDGIQESNCLFVPVDVWQEIGGFDEAFSIPGGGFCNLDLLRRAADSGRPVTVLLGEATFHQYHEGTTTNVDDDEKEARVRSYANTYRQLRGKDFVALPSDQFLMRGRVRSTKMYTLRQRPPFNAPLSITARVRPGTFDRRIDDGLLRYLNGAYVESGLNFTTWRGEQIPLAPGDLMALQDIMHTTRPDRILVTANEPALVRFLSDMADVLGLEAMRIICVADDAVANPAAHVDYVIGAPGTSSTLERVAAKVGAAESVLVLFAPHAGDFFPLDEIRAYARFVSFRSYLVVLRTVMGQPWLGYSKYRLKRVIELFLQESDFAIDESRTLSLVSACSGGFLIRAKPPLPRADDEALEQLAG